MKACACAWRRQAHHAAALLLTLTVSTTLPAQTIDTSAARVVIGEPVSMQIRVRAFDLPASRIQPDCLSLQLQQGDSGLAIAPLQLQVTSTGDDGSAVVRISSPEMVSDPFLVGRLSLNCGAEYVREFTVLADPPRPVSQPHPRARHPTRTPKTARRPAVPAPAAATAPPLITAGLSVVHAASTPASGPAALVTSVPPRLPGAVSAPAAAASTPATGSITRADTPPPASPEPSASNPDIQALARAVLQTLQAQGHVSASPNAAIPTGIGASSPVEMMLPWQELREEQRLTRATLAALQARLERTEREVWRDALMAMATLLGLAMSLLVARVAREWALPRFLSRPTDAASITPRRWGDSDDFNDPVLAGQPSGTPKSAPIPTPTSTSTTHSMSVHWSPSLPLHSKSAATEAPPPGLTTAPVDGNTPSRWPDADFGRACLTEGLSSIDLLQELDTHSDSCPVGCVVVLESRLQEHSGKCPWILLRLLDLYEELEQPWNRERVAAQLEALYNVHVTAADATGSPPTARDLTAQADTLAEVEHAWTLDDPVPALCPLLLRPALIETLDRPAFEDILLLLSVSYRRHAQTTEPASTDWAGSASLLAA